MIYCFAALPPTQPAGLYRKILYSCSKDCYPWRFLMHFSRVILKPLKTVLNRLGKLPKMLPFMHISMEFYGINDLQPTPKAPTSRNALFNTAGRKVDREVHARFKSYGRLIASGDEWKIASVLDYLFRFFEGISPGRPNVNR